MGDKDDIDQEVNKKLWKLITGDLTKSLDLVIECLEVVVVTDKIDLDEGFTIEFTKLERQLIEALLSYIHLVDAEIASGLRSDLDKDDLHLNSMMILYSTKRRETLQTYLQRIRQYLDDAINQDTDSSLYEQKLLDSMVDSIVLVRTDLLVSQPMTNKEMDRDGRKLVVDILQSSHIIIPILEQLNSLYSNHIQVGGLKQFGAKDLNNAMKSEEVLLPSLYNLIETLIEYLSRFKQPQKLDENLYKFHKLTNRQASSRDPKRRCNEPVLENRHNVVLLLGSLREKLSNATAIYEESWSKLLVQLLLAVKNDIRTAPSSPPPSSPEDDSSPSPESPEDVSSSSPERRQKGIPQKGSPIKRVAKCSDGELLEMADCIPDAYKFLDIDTPERSNTSLNCDFKAAFQKVDFPQDGFLTGLLDQGNQADELVEPSEAGAAPPTGTSAMASQEPRNSTA
ncbi:hypothetical protein MKX03_028762 [Papaver bracteatum]|nr:hypothetical protein MKX03_028762 [Papaver bracteatum]